VAGRRAATSIRPIEAAAAIFLAAYAPALADGDIRAGREAAHKCEVCHGLDGKSKVPEAPNLAGQIPQYIIKQLSEFRSGERRNELMSVVAPSLTEKEIEDLAAYYSAIEVTIGKIPGQ
jgi:cytochrome c553